VQWSLATINQNIDHHTMLKQHSSNLDLSICCREVQRGPASIVAGIDIYTVIKWLLLKRQMSIM